MPSSAISYIWRDKDAPNGFRTGVSLHSHTNQSRETLDFLANFGNQFPVMRPLLSRMERRAEQYHGIHVDYAASFWTPPMTPKLAFDLEMRQIERLGLAPMVSITDHDTIKAPMLLRTVPSARQIPVSVEWSAPYGGAQSFHLGVHNLPSARAAEWMATLEDYTAHPSDARLTEILAALHREPNVLVVFNHPMWDLYLIGKEKHQFLVNEFLQKNGAYHSRAGTERAAQLGREPRRAAPGGKVEHAALSGGDRHGVEPNANVNLTNATSFTEFVHEVRREKRSNVLFLAAIRRAMEAPDSSIDHRCDPSLPRLSARVALVGRPCVSSRRRRNCEAVERALAEGVGTAPDWRGDCTCATDGPGTGGRRVAPGMERIRSIAPCAGRARVLKKTSGVSGAGGAAESA